MKAKTPRCYVERAEKTAPRTMEVHGWKLFMPCGMVKHSGAEIPPVTVACRRMDCVEGVRVVNRRKLPVWDF